LLSKFRQNSSISRCRKTSYKRYQQTWVDSPAQLNPALPSSSAISAPIIRACALSSGGASRASAVSRPCRDNRCSTPAGNLVAGIVAPGKKMSGHPPSNSMQIVNRRENGLMPMGRIEAGLPDRIRRMDGRRALTSLHLRCYAR
jgi:hypothetical protein